MIEFIFVDFTTVVDISFRILLLTCCEIYLLSSAFTIMTQLAITIHLFAFEGTCLLFVMIFVRCPMFIMNCWRLIDVIKLICLFFIASLIAICFELIDHLTIIVLHLNCLFSVFESSLQFLIVCRFKVVVSIIYLGHHISFVDY